MSHADPQQLGIRTRKRLPHWEIEPGVYFVTFRLHDSLPREVARAIEAERENIVATAKQMKRELAAHERRRLTKLFSERIERYLNAGLGACHLKDPRVANSICTALRHFDGQRYELFAWCIMPNHVHVVFQPQPGRDLAGILHAWKSFTAKEANRLLGRVGTFWQREYYDHLIRDERELWRVIEYVRDNPVKAGLKDWHWVEVCSP